MATPTFNPAGEVRFDLGRGQISVGGRATRVLLPADALAALCRSAGADALSDFGRKLGTELGRRVRDRLGSAEASVTAVVEHLGGDLALSGLGSLAIEQWGKALVLRVTDSPLGADGDLLLASVIEGALQRGFGRDASVVPLERSDGAARLLVTSAGAARKVRAWLGEGVGWGDALGRLNAG